MENRNYVMEVGRCRARNIGPKRAGGDRVLILYEKNREIVILYPANGTKVDPSSVEGLQLAQA
jgi:hypothetical protein